MQRLVVGYCRVSSQQQVSDGHALERYIGALILYGIPENLVFFDVESGAVENRKGLNDVLALVKTGKVDRVVIPNFDRLTRSPSQWESLRELFAKHGTALKTLEDGELDLHSPDGRLMGRMKAAFAAQVRDRIQAHSKQGHAKHRERKEPYKPIFGYIKIDGELRPNNDLYPESNKSYFEVARSLVDLFLEHKSIGKVINEFRKNYYCHPSRYYGKIHLKAPLTHSLKRWLENAILRGQLQYLSFGRQTPQMIVEGKHKPLITEKEWLTIKAILEDNKLRKKGISTDKLTNVFSGIARCKNCGGLMTMRTNFKRKDGSYGRALSCRRARERDPRCSPEYSKYKGVSLDMIEHKVRNALLTHAKKLVDRVINSSEDSPQINPEAEALIKSIELLESINDSDLQEVIEKKKTQLFLLQESQKMKIVESFEREKRYQDITLLNVELWESMSVHERNLLYNDLIEVIWCDRGVIDIVFKS